MIIPKNGNAWIIIWMVFVCKKKKYISSRSKPYRLLCECAYSDFIAVWVCLYTFWQCVVMWVYEPFQMWTTIIMIVFLWVVILWRLCSNWKVFTCVCSFSFQFFIHHLLFLCNKINECSHTHCHLATFMNKTTSPSPLWAAYIQIKGVLSSKTERNILRDITTGYNNM